MTDGKKEKWLHNEARDEINIVLAVAAFNGYETINKRIDIPFDLAAKVV